MLILVGKSCSGKSTIQMHLKKMGLSPILEYTTRPPRKDEKKRIKYIILSRRKIL